MILVVGATGHLGGLITSRLLARNKPVRVLLRRTSPAAELARQGLATAPETLINAGVQVVYGDLKDRASLDAACADVDVVITTANSALRGGPDTVEAVDRQGNRQLIEAAHAAGVQQFIFISALGASTESPLPFMAAKGHTEAYLRTSGLPYTIIAPTAFMEVWPAMVVGLPAMAGQPVTLMGGARSRQSFISAHDVAAYAVAAIGHSAALNQIIVIGGPEALSYRDVVGIYARVLNRSVTVNFVPRGEPLPGLPTSMSAMLAGMDFDIVVDSSDRARLFGVRPTSLEEAIRRMTAMTANVPA